jgi:hypothetical protein
MRGTAKLASVFWAQSTQAFIVNAQADTRPLIRRLGVAAVLCLLILRGVAYIMMIPSLEPVGGYDVVQAPGSHCEALPGKSELPRSHDADCCALCVPAAREIAFFVVILTEVDVLAFKVKSPGAPEFGRSSSPKPPGLIANWSATSPPRA